jgi:hypothetical protein
MAEDSATELAKKRLEEEKKISDKSRAEFAERMKGKPTPTQEENDIAALGGHITEHEADGSDPDPNVTRNLEAKPASGPARYQTRAATPAHSPSHRE